MSFNGSRHPRLAVGLTVGVGVGSVALVVTKAPLWITALVWITATAVHECSASGPAATARRSTGVRLRRHPAGDRVRRRARGSAAHTASQAGSARRPRSARPPR